MNHYDRRDWLAHLFTLRGSVLLLIAPKVAAFTAMAWGLTWLEQSAHLPSLPMAPFTVVGTALGLLLTFRTTASYDRYWEGRKAWGMIVNRSRNLARQVATQVRDGEARQATARLIAAFAHATKRHLRGDTTFDEVDRLCGAESAAMKETPGPALQSLSRLGQLLVDFRKQQWLDAVDHLRLEENVTALVDQLGICERIKNTPLPIGYVLHQRRFITLYCAGLTLALTDSVGWFSPAIIAFVAYAFLGIERVGIEIENPFERTLNDLDLDTLATTIERDTFALLA